MFDINAPLARQRTVGGKKLIALFDSKTGPNRSVAYWTEDGSVKVVGTDGFFGDSNPHDPCNLHTLPEPLPLSVVYLTFYINPCEGIPYKYESLANAVLGKSSRCNAILEITFDPNTGESSAKTIWRKGE